MNPYQILGVSPESTLEEVERAFQRAAFVNHPNNGGRPEMLAAVVSAYRAVVAEKQRQLAPVGPPAVTAGVTGNSFAVTPKMRGGKKKRFSAVLFHKLLFSFLSAFVVLATGFLFHGFRIGLPSLIAAITVSAAMFFIYENALLGFFQSPQRPILLVSAVSLFVWPLLFPVVVAVISLGTVVFLNRKSGWVLPARKI